MKRVMLARVSVLRSSAYIHNSLGRPDSAITYLRQAMEILETMEDPDPAYQALILNALAEVYHGLGRLDSATTYYQQTIETVRQIDRSAIGGVLFDEAQLLNNIGVAHRILGRPDSALVYLNRSMLIRKGMKDSLMGFSVTLNNIARVYHTLGRPDTSVALYRRALTYNHLIDDPAGEAGLLNNLAYSFVLLGQPDSALAYYRQAWALQQRVCSPGDQGMILNNIGRAMLEVGSPDSALHYLRRGLVLKEEVGGLRGQGWGLRDLGVVYQQMGAFDTALVHFSRALKLFRNSGDRILEGITLSDIGHAYYGRRRNDDLRSAVAYFDSAAAVRSSVRIHAGADENQLSFAEQDIRLFDTWTLANLARAHELGADEALVTALAATERGRAQALLTLMQYTAQPGPAPELDLTTEGTRLVAHVRKTTTAALSYLVTDDTLLVWLIRPSGDLYLERTAITRDSLAVLVHDLRASLGVDEAGERGPPSLERNVRAARAMPGDSLAAKTLAGLVLPAALFSQLPDSGDLVIVPNGILGLVPFAALPVGDAQEMLGLRHAVRYAPSLRSLIEIENARTANLQKQEVASYAGALVVGNPQMASIIGHNGELLHLDPLAGAEEEARWLADKLNVDAVLGSEATEALVKRRIGTAPLVHFATHGYAFSSDARARDTFVALAPEDGEDGSLTVAEVLDALPELTADLVVLSACQTGLGNLKQAEGTVGLQRAFLARGAHSVLVSLWSVSDEATKLLMQRFYSHWLDDTDQPGKAEALRRAQQDVRQMTGFEAPRYWAAFQLVGAR